MRRTSRRVGRRQRRHEELLGAVGQLSASLESLAARIPEAVDTEAADPAASRTHDRNRVQRLAAALKGWAPFASAVLAIGVLGYTGLQTAHIRDQAEAAQEAFLLQASTEAAQSRTVDLEFLSSLSLELTDRGLEISNPTKTPIQQAAFWYLTFHPEIGEQSEVIHEVEGEVGGMPSCSTTTVPWTHLQGAKEEYLEPGEAAVQFQRGESEELHLALQAPSGRWYLLGASGTLLSITAASVDAGGVPVSSPVDEPEPQS